MPTMVAYRDDFVAGVLSRSMLARVATQPYAQGLRSSMNFIPTKTGSCRTIPGTYELPTVDNTGNSRTSREEVFYTKTGSKKLRYLFTNNKVTIFDLSTPNAAAVKTLTIALLAAELYDAQMLNIGDMVWIVHRLHKPQVIKYTGTDYTRHEPVITFGLSPGAAIFTAAPNFPSVIGHHNQRIIFAATDAEPNAVWQSAGPDLSGVVKYSETAVNCIYFNPVNASDGFKIVESGMNGSRISFVFSLDRLVVGTTRDIWISATDYTSAKSDANLGLLLFDLVWANGTGCAPVSPVAIGKSMFFLSATRRAMLAAEITQDGFIASDFSRFNSDAFRYGARTIAAMANPYPTIWVVMGNGDAVVCSVDTLNGVMAINPVGRAQGEGCIRKANWVSVIRGDYEDQVLWSVQESANEDAHGNLQAPFDPLLDILGDGQPHYVDRGRYFHDVGGVDTIADATLLEGSIYEAFADYNPLPVTVALSGSITLDRDVIDAHYGLPMVYYMEPTIPDIPVQGSGQAQVRAVERVVLRLVESYGGAVGPDLDNQQPILRLIPGDYIFGDPIPPESGDFDADIYGWNNRNATIVITQNVPAPIEVAAAIMWLSVTEVP